MSENPWPPASRAPQSDPEPDAGPATVHGHPSLTLRARAEREIARFVAEGRTTGRWLAEIDEARGRGELPDVPADRIQVALEAARAERDGDAA